MIDATLDDIPDEPKKEKKTKKWIEDEYVDDAEVVKLQVGEGIEGLLIDKYPSSKYNAQIYKIQVKGDELQKILVGTTILDKMMKNKVVGDPVRIERLEDGKSTKGKPLQNWKTYHLE